MKYTTKIICIIILAFAGVSGCLLVVQKGLRIYSNHSTERLTEILTDTTNFQMIFIGSSRTHTSINPRIIDSILDINSYNAGVEGGNLFEFNMIFNAYLQNHPPPKYLVLGLDLNSFNLKQLFFNYTQYFNYLDNKVIDSSLSANGHPTFIYKYLPFVMITDFDDYSKTNALKGLLGGGKEIEVGEFQYKGYLSNSMHGIIKSETIVPKVELPVSDTAKAFLDEIILTCQNKGIKLIFQYTPEYNFNLQNNTINSAQILAFITKKAADNNIPYLRDDQLSLCQDSSLFANPGHVNTFGAATYSSILGMSLKTIVAKY